jgi:benzoyl-CoA reductase subunit C
MIQPELNGLEKAQKIYHDRGMRVQDLKACGKKIMGYYCSYPPLEMITAFDFVPFRILGSINEPITKADANIPTIVCPIIRSSLDLALKGRYDFLDGFVAAHTCDCEEKFCRIWKSEISSPYHHYIDLPHVIRKNSFSQFKDKLNIFKNSLEAYTGQKLDPDRLKEEIGIHNHQRSLVRELYNLRKGDPPLLSGAETLQVMISLMSMPIREGSEMLEEILGELKTRKNGPGQKDCRLLVWGSPLTETNLVDMIESLDANVVMDDMCVGTRHFWSDVGITDDPLDGIAKRYLEDINCPRTFREPEKTHKTDLEGRFAYLKEFVSKWHVDAVLLQSVKYCDTHGYEVPDLKDFFESMGVPAMYLEHEYTMAGEAQLKNRVEAFLEIL